ncbi:ribonuclease P protein component 1 [[Eubacterium] cellulosolvens]
MSGAISERNLIQHELIGLQAQIIDTPCKSLKNILGIIVDETMNTFKIEYLANTTRKTIIVQKHKNTFRFTLPSKNVDQPPTEVEINGTLLTKRPEDRIKKLAKFVKKQRPIKKDSNIKSNS